VSGVQASADGGDRSSVPSARRADVATSAEATRTEPPASTDATRTEPPTGSIDTKVIPGADTPPPGARPVATSPWWRRRWQWAGRWWPSPLTTLIGLAGFVAVVALFASVAARLTTEHGRSLLESDTATPVLQAQSILQGHVLLQGWRMLYDSFWTVEVPFYTLGVLITGIDPVLLYVVPGVLAALLLLTAGLMAKQGRRGAAAGAAIGTLIALIGLPSNVWAVVFLHGAWHVGTMLWCLFAFAGLRSGRWRAGWWVAVVFLTAGLLGDLQTVVYGVGPVALAGVLASLRTRRWLAGAPALSAAAASVLAAYLIRKAVTALGGYTIGTINASASDEQIPVNLRNIPSWLPRVFGTGTGDWGNTGVPAALGAVRYVALAAVLIAVLAALWSIVTGVFAGRPGRTGPDHWRIDDMLVLACLADLAFYVYAAQSNLPGYLRYLSPFVVFGSLLAARTAGRWVAAIGPGWPRRALASAGGVVTALFAASFVITAVQPVQPVTGSQLAAFLADRGLTNGIGTYWTSTMTTVASGGQVSIRPVISDHGRLVRYGRQGTADWYTGQQFQFLVYDTTDPWGGVDADTAAATFGPVASTYRLGGYRVLTWAHPLTIDPHRVAG
jgi:hypothetical protein